MVWFSYHGGHTGSYCRHAKDGLRAVIERAIALGFTHYGLSEHCPRDEREHLFPDEADLTPIDLSQMFHGYFAEARALQDEYAGRIALLVGFETERLPQGSYVARMQQLRTELRADYIVGSVHDLDGYFVDYKPEVTAEIAERCGGVEAMQLRYFDALIELITALKPEVVGHLDLIRKFDGPNPHFSERVYARIDDALEAARATGAVLDVNCGALRRGLSPVYPLPRILKRAQHIGVGVTLGDDSHGIDSVGGLLDASLHAIADAGYDAVTFFERTSSVVTRRSAPLNDVKPKT
jgi:histidinol-phosphatase (PHP family)